MSRRTDTQGTLLSLVFSQISTININCHSNNVLDQHHAKRRGKMSDPLSLLPQLPTVRSATSHSGLQFASVHSFSSSSHTIQSTPYDVGSQEECCCHKHRTKVQMQEDGDESDTKADNKVNINNARDDFIVALCIMDCWEGASMARDTRAKEALDCANLIAVEARHPSTPDTRHMKGKVGFDIYLVYFTLMSFP